MQLNLRERVGSGVRCLFINLALTTFCIVMLVCQCLTWSRDPRGFKALLLDLDEGVRYAARSFVLGIGATFSLRIRERWFYELDHGQPERPAKQK